MCYLQLVRRCTETLYLLYNKLDTMAAQHTHLGRNVKRLREILGMKQETLAIELGGDWNQKKISLLESKDTIDRPLLEQIAGVLKLPVDAIENFNDDSTVNIVTNTFQDFKDRAVASPVGMNYQCTFNPFEKLEEVMEENRKLYERLLEEKEEKVKLLERMLGK